MEEETHRQKILVLGWRKYVALKLSSSQCNELTSRAGKSSCIKTIFQGVPVTDVPYFDSTQKLEKVVYEYALTCYYHRSDTDDSTIVPLEIWDTPSNFDTDSPELRLGTFATIIYVMDMQVSIRYM